MSILKTPFHFLMAGSAKGRSVCLFDLSQY